MIQMTVGDFKSRFSQVIASVIEGEEVEILYGRAKKPVAKVSNLSKNNQKRQSFQTGCKKSNSGLPVPRNRSSR